MNFKIKHIDNIHGTIEIDWLNGITLIHNIPLYILENPGLSQERIIQELEYMRPPIPEPIEVPEALLDLVEEPEPEQQELADYRQALLDVPQQDCFPNETDLPTLE